MKSSTTGKEMILRTERETVTFRKEKFEVFVQYYFCEETGEEVETEEMMENSLTQVYNAYRVKHNLPFPEEIKAIREKYDLSPSKMSQILGFGINQYKNYEDGDIPTKSNSNLILSANNPVEFRKLVEWAGDLLKEGEKKKLLTKIEKMNSLVENPFIPIDFNEILIFGGFNKPSITNGYKVASLEKIFNVLLFFTQHDLNPFKTKINKLFFYLDFAHYRKYGTSVCGLEYRAINYGPVPKNYDSIFTEAEIQSYVDKVVEYDMNFSREQFVPSEKRFNASLFNEQELETMQYVVDKFKDISTSRIVDLSHEEEGWVKEEKKKGIISYDYSYFLKHI